MKLALPLNLLRFGQINLTEGYHRIREETTSWAGKPDSIVQRSVMMHSIYRDSKQNFTFAEIVAHSGFWSRFLFEYHNSWFTKLVSFLVSPIPPFKKKWNEKLRVFCETLQQGNRRIFIDIVSAYFFSKLFGKEPGANEFVSTPLLEAFNEIHDATKTNTSLSEEQKKHIFLRCVDWEQRLIDPTIKQAYSAFDIPVFRQVVINPIVHLSFIPKYKAVFYRNFTELQERLVKGRKIYEIAVSRGWAKVTQALRRYKDCPQNLELEAARYQNNMAQTMANIKQAVNV